MTTCDEDDLQAFVDAEQLPPERRRMVMAHLAARPEEEARIGDYRRLGKTLHLLYDDVLNEPLPARLRVARRRGWRRRLAPLAAGISVLIIASAGGSWMLDLRLSEPELTSQPVYNERESLLHQLSELVGQAVYVPNLQEAGFGLRGGHVLPAAPPASYGGSAEQPAALLMYENPIHPPDGTLSGKPAQQIAFSISLGMVAHDDTIRLGSEGGVTTIWWMEGPFAYALRGALRSEQLFAIGKIIQQRQALTVPPPEQKRDAA